MFKEFKQAKGYNINYHNHCIPKNAIYGRLTKTVYVYIRDFSPFYNDDKLARVYIMDIKKHDNFKPFLIKRDNIIFKLAHDYVCKNNIDKNTKCENVLCMNRSYKPTERRTNDYVYNARGRDNSQNDCMHGIKYREITEHGYRVGQKASLVASSIRV